VTHAQTDKVRDNDIKVVGEVGLLPNSAGGFILAVTLEVEIVGLDQAKAEEIVKQAHAVCPYSNAIKGNVDVKLNVTTR
jgi:Ohr subfamily peroxiredoxin